MSTYVTPKNKREGDSKATRAGGRGGVATGRAPSGEKESVPGAAGPRRGARAETEPPSTGVEGSIGRFAMSSESTTPAKAHVRSSAGIIRRTDREVASRGIGASRRVVSTSYFTSYPP